MDQKLTDQSIEPSVSSVDPTEESPLAPPARPPFKHDHEAEPSLRRASSGVLVWMTAMIIVLLIASVLVPRMVEEVQYSLSRGRQRADYELAGQLLQTASLSDVSRASQLVSLRISPSVVIINVSSAPADEEALTEEQLLQRYQRPHEALGQGSGVIISADGYILTNHHVVRDAQEMRVTLSDGRRLRAEHAGIDKLTDLALLKVDTTGLSPAEWGDSDALQVGSLIWAVGSPFGLERSVSFGILSAKNRGAIAGLPHQDFLQTDAAINPGNSGGPLVDAQGRVVGINTAIVGQTYSGVSFAIPSNVAREVAERLQSSGYVPRAWLGVELSPVTDQQAQRLGLAMNHGALVARMVPKSNDSPAQRAGIAPGDVLLRWNGVDILDSTMLSQLVARTKVGATVKAQVWRDGQALDVDITVVERPREFN
jgi:serine protease Do